MITTGDIREVLKSRLTRHNPDKKLHTKEHVLADDLSRILLEPKKFAAYLGLAQLYKESDLRALARRVLEKKDLPPEARGKYFFAAVRSLYKKPGARLKNKKKKKQKRKNGPRKKRTTQRKSSPHDRKKPAKNPTV